MPTYCAADNVVGLQDSEPAAPAADQEWAAALLKIKNRDASIYDGSTQLFPKEPAQVPKKRAVPSTSKGKKKVLRQVLFEQVRNPPPWQSAADRYHVSHVLPTLRAFHQLLTSI